MSNQSNEMKAVPTCATKQWLIWKTLKLHCVWALPAGVLMSIFGACVVPTIIGPEFEATHILQANHDFVLSKDCVGGRNDLAKNEFPLIMSPEVLDVVLADPQFKSIPSLAKHESLEREIRKRLQKWSDN